MENDIDKRVEQLEAKVDALMHRVTSLEGKKKPKKSRKQTSDYHGTNTSEL